MDELRFFTLDVFTETALAGNPLAVVVDADGLDDQRMQAIAREFNLSETVFVLEPRNPVHSARVRIFTPTRELPFAGHPTIGAACLIGHLRAQDMLGTGDLRIVLEEPVGDVVCLVRRRQGRALAADFALPRLPERLEGAPTPAEIALGLGLTPDDIGFDRHQPSLFSAGAPFLFVPVRSLPAVARPRLGDMPWSQNLGPAAYLYTREVVETGSAFHARMFGGGWACRKIPRPEAPPPLSPASRSPSNVRRTASTSSSSNKGSKWAPKPHRPWLRGPGRGVAIGQHPRLGGDCASGALEL